MAANPVIVESPAADSAEMPVFLRAAELVVTATPYLDWQPAAAAADGSARVSLSTFQMFVAFAPRCAVSRIPADLTAARAVNVLILRLQNAAWARILEELLGREKVGSLRSAISLLAADSLHLGGWVGAPRAPN